MTTASNWSDNFRFVAARLHRPISIDAVRRLVAATPRIHAVGARHSFNGSADSPGDMVDLADIPPAISIDAERRTVSVGAATTYAVLARYLQAEGWALHNMASLPHITVAGAISTGTHGSGDRLGTLSSAVSALELVTADGELLRIGRGEPGFDGMVVGLGAFGVVTRLKLDIEPSYAMRQDAFAELPWTTLLTDLDAVMSAGTSVSLFTQWSGDTVGRMWIKARLPPGEAGAMPAPPRGARPAEHPSARGTAIPLSRLTPFGVAGPWSERLCHMRPEFEPSPREQIQSEYILPRAQAVAAITRLRAIAGRIDALLGITEIRSTTGDAAWLSPAHGRDSVALHFTWKQEPQAVDALTQEIEEMLISLGGRPHWGKLMPAPARSLAPLYPKWEAFRSLVRAYDASGKFDNAFLAHHLWGAPA
jgi:alditol oxidase